MKRNYTLIQTFTEDEIQLSGLYQQGDKAKEAVILIHGFLSDFYSHKFIHSIAGELEKNRNAIVLAQTRGTGLHTEFLKKDKSGEYIGSYYEVLEESHFDISAFIEFLLGEGYEKIVLAGHSLGTIKVVRYLFEGRFRDQVSKLILLAPFDKNAFMVKKAGDKWTEFLATAKAKIEEGKGDELVPVPQYEDFPITYKTFYSWYNKDEMSCIWDFYKQEQYGPTVLQEVKIPIRVILGEKDEFVNYPEFKENARSVIDLINDKLPQIETVLVEGANHTYKGYEEDVSKEVANFLS